LASPARRKIEDRSDVVVITGASGGVGRATARLFAQDGAKIALLVRGENGLEAAAIEAEELGGKDLVLPTNVADAAQVEAAAQCGGDHVPRHGLGHACCAEADGRRNRGRIVKVGSALAFRGILLQAPYCGAKHACKGFTESVITEIRHHGWGIHVAMVHLAGFTPRSSRGDARRVPKQTQPVPPIYQPEIAAVRSTGRRTTGPPDLRRLANRAQHPRRAHRAVVPRLVSGEDRLRLADDETPATGGLARGRCRRGRDGRGSPAEALGDRAPQLGDPGVQVVRMRLLEHGDECTHLSLAEAHVPGFEGAIEVEREVAVTLGNACTSRCRGGKRAHDVTRNDDDLAVQCDLDCLCHLLLCPESLAANYLRGLKA
jgi:NAD(P)-dependent dehydrogenase (short-subunit alcohol dehydrogenase family)